MQNVLSSRIFIAQASIFSFPNSMHLF